ncbi:MAG: hypothetical protein WCI04_06285, partial [archaeon]
KADISSTYKLGHKSPYATCSIPNFDSNLILFTSINIFFPPFSYQPLPLEVSQELLTDCIAITSMKIPPKNKIFLMIKFCIDCFFGR